MRRRFTLPARCDVASFVIREVNGHDEQHAALQVEARGEARTSHYNELIRLSLVEVDGEAVTQPFLAMEEWNTRTRSLLLRGYDKVNGLEDEEVAVFLTGAEVVEPMPAADAPSETTDTRTRLVSGLIER